MYGFKSYIIARRLDLCVYVCKCCLQVNVTVKRLFEYVEHLSIAVNGM